MVLKEVVCCDILPTTKVEFIIATSHDCQAMCLRRILETLQHPQDKCIVILCDSSSTIKLSRNTVMHGKSKHIDVNFHFLRDLVKDKVIELVHFNTQDQVIEIMIKPLKSGAFKKLHEQLEINQFDSIVYFFKTLAL